MRIAVSGTHSVGKSSLIDRFLSVHPDFEHEDEPFYELQEMGEAFESEPTIDDFIRQLEFSRERLRNYQSGDDVIFERSPVDFLAYILALEELGRGDSISRHLSASFIESATAIAGSAVRLLDLILFLPIEDSRSWEIPASEDLELRVAVDGRLSAILMDNELDLFSANTPKIVEARGTTTQRLQILESELARGLG